MSKDLRICTKCGEAKPATTEYFCYRPKVSSGLSRQCKVCSYAAVDLWKQRNKDHAQALSKAWAKAHPERVQASRDKWAAAHPEYRAQYRAENRERINAKSAAWCSRHPERCKEYKDKWVTEHPERSKEARVRWRKNNPEKSAAITRNYQARKEGNGGTHTAADIQDQYERQKGKCFYCNVKVGKKYHVDHFVPLVKGGSNGPENLVIACPTCNLKKHDKHPMDFCGRLL